MGNAFEMHKQVVDSEAEELSNRLRIPLAKSEEVVVE